MALVYMDGFDHVNPSRYTQTGGAATFASTPVKPGGSTYSYQCGYPAASTSQVAFPSLPTGTTYYIGFAVRTVTDTGFPVISVLNDVLSASLVDITFVAAGSGKLSPVLKKGSDGSVIASTTITFATGTWAHVGCSITIGSSGGVTLYTNGIEEGSLNGIDLRNGGTTDKGGGLKINTPYNAGGAWFLDDLYVLDNTGSKNNVFPGDLSVLFRLPNAPGSATNWSRSTGTLNWYLVADPGTGASDYVYSAAAVDDLYAMADLPATGVYSVNAVQVCGIASSNDVVTPRNVALIGKSGTDISEGPTYTLTATNANYYAPLNTAPGGAPWTKALFDAMEVGIRGKP